MKLKILITILLSFFVLTSCSQKKEEEGDTVYTYDPNAPGSNVGGAVVVRPLINFKACPNMLNNANCPETTWSDVGKVTLTWEVPNLYKTEEYVVVILKLQEGGIFDNPQTREELKLPQNNLGVVSFEVARLKNTVWVDTDITPGNKYLYYGFVIMNGYLNPAPLTGQQVLGRWSAHSLAEVLTTNGSGSETIPNAMTFWQNRQSTYAGPAGMVGDVRVANLRTFDPGDATTSFPKGRIALDSSGSTMFVADTDNNRIVVWENANLRQCLIQLLNNEQADDPEIRDMYIYSCYLNNMSSPLAAYNILGQPSQYTTMSCQDHNLECGTYLTQQSCLGTHSGDFSTHESFCQWKNNTCQVKGNQCLTQPTEILYDKGRLIVSDTGNDRVVVYDNILFSPASTGNDLDMTLIGCDRETIPSQIRPTKCAFQKVLGKKGFDDFTKYTLSAGESSLNGPTGLMVDGDDLYIADTLNNRIVKSSNFYGTEDANWTDVNMFYNCDETSWLTSMCRWSGVMGQQNYAEKYTFQNFYDADPDMLTGTFSNIVSDGNLLKRYFRHPTKLSKMYKENGDLIFLVLAHEDFYAISDIGTSIALRSRILMFDDIPIKGSSPMCNSMSFISGACDASAVIGQEDFDKLIILSGVTGGAGDYKNITFGLDAVHDFDVKGRDIYAVDGKNNQVYIWRDLPKNTISGKPYTFKVLDPQGAYVNAQVGNLPILEGLSGISYAESGDYIFVVDAGKGYIYHLSFFSMNL